MKWENVLSSSNSAWQVFFSTSSVSPLGSVLEAALMQKTGMFVYKRLLGRYCMVLVTDGSGTYEDLNAGLLPVEQGDLVIAFPHVEHSYGPYAEGHWNELYVVFEGPIFDLMQAAGVLDPSRPVQKLKNPDKFELRVRSILVEPADVVNSEAAKNIRRTMAFAQLLTEEIAPETDLTIDEVNDPVIRSAAILLSQELGIALDIKEVARKVGIGYESLRKRFVAAYGVPPAKYRNECRIMAARDLLINTSLTAKHIGESLGFNDGGHFSRLYRQRFGYPPGAERRRK